MLNLLKTQVSEELNDEPQENKQKTRNKENLFFQFKSDFDSNKNNYLTLVESTNTPKTKTVTNVTLLY